VIRFLGKSLLVVPLLLLTLASLQVFTDLLLKVDCDTWEASVEPLQPGEHKSTHLPDGHRLATTCLDVDFLKSVKIISQSESIVLGELASIALYFRQTGKPDFLAKFSQIRVRSVYLVVSQVDFSRAATTRLHHSVNRPVQSEICEF